MHVPVGIFDVANLAWQYPTTCRLMKTEH